MSTHLDNLIVAAISEQIRETGTTRAMDVVDDVMAQIDPTQYEATLRLIVSQRVEVGTPESSA